MASETCRERGCRNRPRECRRAHSAVLRRRWRAAPNRVSSLGHYRRTLDSTSRRLLSKGIRQSLVFGLSLIGKALIGPGRQPDSAHSVVVKKLIRDRAAGYEFGELAAVARKSGDVALSGA